jgi:DNA-directed RNA polymerase II subunit RPB1
MQMKNETPSKIIGIQFSLLSPEEIERNSVAEITNKETYTGIKPKINGLFDPRMGVLEPGLVCPTDGQNYIDCPGYFGHIKLAKPVYYIQYIEEIRNILRCVCIKCSRLLLNKKTNNYLLSYKPSERWERVKTITSKITRCGDDIPDGCECLQPSTIQKEGISTLIAEWTDKKNTSSDGKITLKLTPEVVIKIFKKITDEDVDFMGFSSKWSRPEWMVCQNFAVPPPSVRPSVKHDAQQRSEDDLTHIIINIIKYNNLLKEQLTKTNPPAQQKSIDDYSTILQYYVASLVDNNISGADPVQQRSGRALKSISDRHKGKTGRVRGNLMGKRVDFSARTVIACDPELSIIELGVPMKIAMNLTKPVYVNETNKDFLTYLVKNGPDIYPGAKILELANGDSISLRYHDRDNIVLKVGDTVHRHLMNGDYVLFNRQPTLHRMSMMAHVVRVMEKGDTFRMNVADTKPYNADFDGDEMNMHMPQNDEAEMELKYLAAVRYQIISPALNKSIIGIFQDSLLGSFLFTRENIMIPRKRAMNLLAKCNRLNAEFFLDNKEYYSSFEILSNILPPLTLKYKTNLFKKIDEGKESSSNNVLEIENGVMKRGQFEKDSLCGGGRGLIQRINNDFSEQECQYFIDNLQSIITEYMKECCFSVGMSDLIPNDETTRSISNVIVTKKKEVSNLIDQLHLGILDNKSGKTNEEYFELQVNNILNQASKEAEKIGIEQLNKDNRFIIIVSSGSKGSALNISQMISCLGQQNVDNKRIPYSYPNRTLPHFKQFDDSPVARGYVENSFISGLTPEELFFHAMGGRVGLIDTAVKTSQTGYIQRRLIKSLEDVYVAYDRTVRNNKQKIIQYIYGGTNFDTVKVENINFDLIEKKREQIYDMYNYGYEKKEIKSLQLVFNKPAFERYKQQIPNLKERVKSEIKMIITAKNEYIELIAENKDFSTIFLPVSFLQVIKNIYTQFKQKSSLTDITPMEAYKMIDDNYKLLDYVYKPCYMFKIAYYYYLNPSVIIVQNRFTQTSLEFLLQKINLTYKRSLVNPGEMVGLISAQSIGQPTTQMTLNTFHFAGVSDKSNVTRGLPRMEEILSLTTNMKNPSMTIFLKKEDDTNKDKAFEMISRIENTKLKNIVLKSEIYYDPDESNTRIEKDIPLMERYKEFSDILNDCNLVEEEQKKNRWILRLTLNKIMMLEKNITVEEINYSLKTVYEDGINCFYNDIDSEEVVFRISLNKSNKLIKTNTIDEDDNIYILKSFQENILNNIVLRGINNISKVNVLKINKYNILNTDTGDYEKKDIYALDTTGSNLLGVLSLDYIDAKRTYSNNIMEIQAVLGIEAARKCLFNELLDVLMEGEYVNHHHIALLCDRMTCNKKMVSVFRHGINNDDIGPIAKASFEETTEMFLKAARHGELDEMRGVSANVMCGQQGYYGTSAFSVYLNFVEMEKLEKEASYVEKEKTEIFEDLLSEMDDEECTIQKLKINHNLNKLKADLTKEQQHDNGYNIEF